MKRIAAIAAFAAAALNAGAVEIDGVAATVGVDSILRSDVEAELRRNGFGPEKFAEVRNSLIERRLVLKAAAESKMTMQDWVVESRIREIVENAFDGDRNKLIAALARDMVPYSDWRNRVKEDLVAGAMRWNAVEKNVSASPAEMKAEYAAHPDRYMKGETATVGVILLKPQDAAKRDEVSAAIAKTSFREAARKYSADPKAAEGGIWKDVSPAHAFSPEVAAEIAKLEPGETSEWIELDGWNFLVSKLDASPAGKLTFAEAYDDIEKNVKAANAKKLYGEWMDRLKAGTYIKIY